MGSMLSIFFGKLPVFKGKDEGSDYHQEPKHNDVSHPSRQNTKNQAFNVSEKPIE